MTSAKPFGSSRRFVTANPAGLLGVTNLEERFTRIELKGTPAATSLSTASPSAAKLGIYPPAALFVRFIQALTAPLFFNTCSTNFPLLPPLSEDLKSPTFARIPRVPPSNNLLTAGVITVSKVIPSGVAFLSATILPIKASKKAPFKAPIAP